MFRGFPDEVTFSSDHFRYHAHADDSRACAGALVALEAHFNALQAFLHFDWPRDRLVDYWLFKSGGDFLDYMPCGAGVPICTIGSNVFTYAVPDEHELVHAYLAATGFPPHLLIEGMAVLLSADTGPWSAHEDLRELLGAFDWRDVAAWREAKPGDRGWYLLIGSYVARLLVDRFGMPAVLAYYGEARYSRDPDAVNADFERSFGMSLERAISEGLAVDYPDGPCLRPYACSAPFLTLDESPLEVPRGCSGGFIDRRFQVPSETGILVQVQANSGDVTGPRVRSCDGQASPRGGGGMQSLVWLAPGTYSMRLTASGPFSYQILSGANQWISRDCAAAETAPLEIDARSGVVAVPRTGDTYYVGLSSDSPRRRYFQWSPLAASNRKVRFCRSCAVPPESCLPFDDVALDHTWEGRYVLVVPTDVALGDFATITHYDPTVPQ